jgi:hypothetical protein
MLLSTSDIRYQPLQEAKAYDLSKKVIDNYKYLLPEELDNISKLLEHNTVIEFMTQGSWSSHHLLEKILRTVGPSTVIITTWAITEKPIRALYKLKQEGLILKLGGLFEKKIRSHNPKAYGFAKEVFDKLAETSCHAKVTIIENDNWKIAINSSANYTINKRTEVGTIHCSKESVDFHKKWIFKNGK